MCSWKYDIYSKKRPKITAFTMQLETLRVFMKSEFRVRKNRRASLKRKTQFGQKHGVSKITGEPLETNHL